MGRFAESDQVADVLRARVAIVGLLEREESDAQWPPAFPHNSEYIDSLGDAADLDFDLNDAIRELLDFLLRWALTRVEENFPAEGSHRIGSSPRKRQGESVASLAGAPPPTPPTAIAESGAAEGGVDASGKGNGMVPSPASPSPYSGSNGIADVKTPLLSAAIDGGVTLTAAKFFLPTMDGARIANMSAQSSSGVYKMHCRGGAGECH